MRVWIAPSSYFPHRGGVEEHALQLARQLQRRGHKVLVVAPRHPRSLPASEEIDGTSVTRLAFDAPSASLGSLVDYPFSLLRQFLTLLGLSRSHRPDLINVHCASVQVPVITLLCLLLRIPLVLTSHGETEMDAGDLYGQSRFMRTILRWSSRRARALTVCSAWTARSAGRIAPRFLDAEVIANGIDPTQWSVAPPVADPVVCAWGRHVPQKGFDLLLSAFDIVRHEIPAARLLLGGDGPETARLTASAGPSVTLVGPLDRQGVQSLLGRSRLAVVPSRLEPFGIVAVEAMATGRPVVWSGVGGLRDATRGVGWEVDPTDVAALANAIISALRTDIDPLVMRSHVESHSWSVVCERYLEVYERCLRPGPPGRREAPQPQGGRRDPRGRRAESPRTGQCPR